MDLEGWALENAAAVVENVERHGIPLTWSEAHQRLIRTAALVDAPEYVVQPDAPPTLIERVDTTPPWQRPGFAEEVACGAVHYAGKRYVPRDPDASDVGVAVPWSVAAETVQRLNFVLALRLEGAHLDNDHDGLVSLALLLVRLSADVAAELNWTGDEDIVADDKINGRRYLLVRSADIRHATRYLRESEAMVTTADTETAVSEFSPGLHAFMTDPEALNSLLWELDWWTAAAA